MWPRQATEAWLPTRQCERARPYTPAPNAPRCIPCPDRCLVSHGPGPRPVANQGCGAVANCRRTALHVCVPNTKPGAARRGRRGGAAPVLAAVENCEAVCRLVGWRRMRGAWDAWCCYNYPPFKGIVRDPKLSLNSLPLGGPSSSLKTQREKRVTAFAACPEKSLMHCCPLIRLPFAVPVSGVSSCPRFRID